MKNDPGRARTRSAIIALIAGLVSGCPGPRAPGPTLPDSSRVKSIEFITYGGAPVYSAALNKIAFHRFDPKIIGGPELSGKNDNTGTFELWVADPDGSRATCISCRDVPNGPRMNQHKGAPTWHPSGQWIVAAVEMPVHAASHAKTHAGTGAYVDLWAISPDGRRWFQLTRYTNSVRTSRFPNTPVGALIPRFSRRGDHLVWAEMIGYGAKHPFGIWRLVLGEFMVDAAGPRLKNLRRFEPGAAGTTFYEAWSFSPDDTMITVASESGAIHPGYMDVQIWNPHTGTLVNLTKTNDQFEEQAVFSPDGRWIAFMSTQGQSPRYDPSRNFWGTFRTDVWLMRADGSGAERLTHFSDPAHREYLPGAVNRAIPVSWAPDGRAIYINVDQNQGSRETHETQRIYRINLR